MSTRPIDQAYVTASRTAVGGGVAPRLVSPRDMLMTSPPLSAHQRIAEATQDQDPAPVSSKTLATRMPDWLTPEMPAPLLVEAAAMPVTWVPWPLVSRASGDGLVKSRCATTRAPGNSSCVPRKPVSMMHTVLPVVPKVVCQAWSAGAPCTLMRVRAYWLGRLGSFGLAWCSSTP